MRKVSSSTYLLDVNVLLALAWPNHQFHRAARRRLESSSARLATCALTQLGFIRLSSNPSVVGVIKSPSESARLLSTMVSDARHVYLNSLPEPASAQVAAAFRSLLGGRQVTDAYLLYLARQNRDTLLTFDSRLAALAPASTGAEVLAPA